MTLIKPSCLQAIVLDRSSGTSQTKPAPARQRSNWKRSTDRHESDLELRLSSGSTFRLELTGDVEFVAEENEDAVAGDQQQKITYHELVDRCCRQFTLVPKSSVCADTDTPKV